MAKGNTRTSVDHRLVEHLFRHQAGVMLAVLTRIFGAQHMDLAEDVVQDALVRALEIWPYSGVPVNPRAWLIQAAKNRALDVLRHRKNAPQLADSVLHWDPPANDPESLVTDPVAVHDVVSMLFLCAHPSIPRDSRVALALKVVAGLGVAEIARAFLVDEATIAQRIVRAKRAMRDGQLSLGVPVADELSGRLQSVLDVLYLWFNEGYGTRSGADLIRSDVCSEALRIGGLLLAVPALSRPEVHALLALMALSAARFPARMDAEGNLLLLRDQDRSLWDRGLLARGFAHFERASEGDVVTAFHLEAGIAACHAAAPSYEQTDWTRIVSLYDDLVRLKPTPVIVLNRAVATSRLHGASAALAVLRVLEADPSLAGYHLLPAVIAELCVEVGDPAQAALEYRRALGRQCSEPERQFLEKRLTAIAR